MEKKRKYRQVHDYYLTEWLGITYPPGTWRVNVPLGDMLIAKDKPITPEERRQLGGMLGANADAVAVTASELHIFEAMVRHEPGAMEDLLKYGYLIRYTTDYQPFIDFPVKLFIVTPLDLGWTEKFYEKYGIKTIYYKPTWVLEYLHTYPRGEWRGKLSRLAPVE